MGPLIQGGFESVLLKHSLWTCMARVLEEDEWLDSMEEYARRVLQEVNTVEYEDWRHNPKTFSPEQIYRLIADDYGRGVEGDTETKNSDTEDDKWEVVSEAISESGLEPDEVVEGIRWRSNKKGKGGRPSKVDRWEQRIEDGAATLEDAQENMGRSTWYKLKSRVEE